MNCQQIKLKLADYLLDNISITDKHIISEHLEQCSICAKEVELFKQTEFLLTAIQLEEPPADLWTKVEQQIQIKESVVSKMRIKWNSFMGLKLKPIPTFATAIIAILILSGIWWQYRSIPVIQPISVEDVEEPIDVYVAQHTVSTYEDPGADKNSAGLMIVAAAESTGDL
jgi:predicted anti-sigma-YlaC factor YlaD